MKSTNELLSKYSPTVNSIDKDNTLTLNSNKTTIEKIEILIKEENITPEGIAIQLSEILNDTESVSYYTLLVKEINPAILLDTAYYVQDIDKSGKIRTKKAVYFQGVLKRKGYTTKFRK